MHTVPHLLVDLALVLGVAGLTSLLCRILKLPVVLGYMLAGILVGPKTTFALITDEGSIRTLAELGVILLMFSLGLEFSLQRLWRAGPTALLMGSVQVGLALLVGYLAALGLGFTQTEAFFVGAALSISSTMVLAKTFEEERPTRTLRETVVSVLVVQDLFAILLLTGLITYARVGGLHTAALGGTLLKLGLFLVAVLVVGRLLVPRLLRWVADHARSETLLVTSVGLCFSLAVVAAQSGFSVALGAFLAGMLGAESGRTRAIEHVIHPLRDLFTAIFFVAVGMLLDPGVTLARPGTILLLTLLVIVSNAVAITASGLLAGLPLRTSFRSGLALGQMGEFGYIILGSGIAAGVVAPGLHSIAVAVGILTAFATPLLLRASLPLSAWAEGLLPSRWHASLGLYQAWAASLRGRGIRRGEGRLLLRPFLFLLLDVALLAAMVLTHSFLSERTVRWLEAWSHLGLLTVRVLTAAILGALGAAMVLAILRRGRILARDLAVLAPNPQAVGQGRQGRHLLAGGLRMALLLMVGLPLLALLQPFAPRGMLLVVSCTVFAMAVLVQLRRARRLERQVPLGSEWLLARVRAPWDEGAHRPSGTLRALRLGPRCPSLGRTLMELDLPGRADITLITLLRQNGDQVPLHPLARLMEGDLLAITGSEAALDEAEALLGEPDEPWGSQA